MKSSYLVAAGLLIGGGLVLLILQNPTPVLALTFLGWQTPMLPLAVWLVVALASGALTLGGLVQLLPSRAPASKYRPTAYSRFSEEPPPRRAPQTGQRSRSPDEVDSEPAWTAEPMGSRPATTSEGSDSEWGEWTRLRSPTQREDWEAPVPRVDVASAATGTGEAPQPRSPSRDSSWNWWPFSNQAEQQRQQAENSWQDLAEGWDEVDDTASRYRPEGGSPVQDALDDITEGWDDDQATSASAYSHGYGADSARRDAIYAPADDQTEEEDWEDRDSYANDYDNEEEETDVVDADYRVIIPPYSPTEPEPPATGNDREEDDDDDNWVDVGHGQR